VTLSTPQLVDRAWGRWSGEGRNLTIRHSVLSVDGELVTFVADYDLPNRAVQSQSTLRFPSKEQIDVWLRQWGFSNITYYGDWSGSLWTSNSPEIIVIAA
jgi:hypothetical protein